MKDPIKKLDDPLVDLAFLDGKLVSVKVREDKIKTQNSPKTGIFLINTPKLPKI
jgi:hypothetical protein